MSRGVSFILILLILSLSLFCVSCSDNVSGGVSEEANALLIINGNVTDTNGVAIDSARVIAIPSDYIPGDTIYNLDSLSAISDSLGYYEILVDDSTRMYNVYAVLENRSAIIWNQTSPDTSYIDLKLKENGALRIVLPDTLDTINGEIFIEGFTQAIDLESSKVSSKAGYAVLFPNLPSGLIKEISYQDNTLGIRILDTLVEVIVGDTQTVLPQNEYVLDGLDYSHLNIGNSNLPTNSVYSSFVGKTGICWFATEKGAVKYEVFDDTTWTVYDKSNSTMTSITVNCIYYDDASQIVWIGLHGGGLAKFDGSVWTTWKEESSDLPHDNIYGIVPEPGRGLWLATDGGVVLVDGDDDWTIFNSAETDLVNDNVISIDIKNGTKWIASAGGSIAKIDASDNITVYDDSDNAILANGIYCIKTDPNSDAIWVGTQQGLLKFSGGTWSSFDAGDWGNTESRVSSVAIDKDGKIWVGTFSGLLSYDGSTWIDHSGHSGGQLGSKIEDIYIDSAGNKWCSLFSNGVVVFSVLP